MMFAIYRSHRMHSVSAIYDIFLMKSLFHVCVLIGVVWPAFG